MLVPSSGAPRGAEPTAWRHPVVPVFCPRVLDLRQAAPGGVGPVSRSTQGCWSPPQEHPGVLCPTQRPPMDVYTLSRGSQKHL